jgi:DNA adenine methylase
MNLMKSSPRIIELSYERVTVRALLGGRTIESREIVQPTIRPIVKWAGGKQWLAPAAPHLTPDGFDGRYYEPFFGGGAFFFALEPAAATLSDRNETLITTYQALRADAASVIRLLNGYPYEEDFYYRMRSRSPRTNRSIAARLLYLNRTCWNGLYRVNRDGKFNTPFGRFDNPTICDPGRLCRAARLLHRAKLRVGDFETITAEAKSGDFAYFDPPYITGHQHNGFLKYNAPLFSWDDQQRLARLALRLADANVYVLVSNADQPSVVNLYKGFNYYRVARQSSIGSNISSRGEVVEALLSSYPLLGCESEVI